LSGTYGIRVEVNADPTSGVLSTRPVGRHTTRGTAGRATVPA
jgi:iron complex transport system ATP-binding protein